MSNPAFWAFYFEVFWNVTLCIWISGSPSFEGTLYFHVEGQAAQNFGLLDP